VCGGFGVGHGRRDARGWRCVSKPCLRVDTLQPSAPQRPRIRPRAPGLGSVEFCRREQRCASAKTGTTRAS